MIVVVIAVDSAAVFKSNAYGLESLPTDLDKSRYRYLHIATLK